MYHFLRRGLVCLLCLALAGLIPCAGISADTAPEATPAAGSVKHYLFLGEDYYVETAAASTRTDTLILVSLDEATGRILFTSILRDSKVTTPKGGEVKLNTVYHNHGYEGIAQVLSSHLGVQIEGVILFSFETIKHLIDEFGGVDIDISRNEYNMIHSILLGEDPNMPDGPGLAHMTGRIALAYMRDRSSGAGDFTRTEHQRKVLQQLLLKADSMTLPQLLKIFNITKGEVKTNLNPLQLVSVLQSAYGLLDRNAEIVEHVVPVDRTFSYGTLRGSSILNVRWKRNREILNALLYPAEEDAPRDVDQTLLVDDDPAFVEEATQAPPQGQ